MPTHQSPDTHGMTYRIVMNEQQRKFIEDALKGLIGDADAGTIPDVRGKPFFLTADYDELQTLYNMTRELPEIEKEHPRTLHGFCL